MRFPFITAPMMLEKSEKKPPYELKQAILAKSRKIKKNNSQPWPPQNGPPGGSLRPRVEKSQNWILKIPD
jgi:hypothetical protein